MGSRSSSPCNMQMDKYSDAADLFRSGLLLFYLITARLRVPHIGRVNIEHFMAEHADSHTWNMEILSLGSTHNYHGQIATEEGEGRGRCVD